MINKDALKLIKDYEGHGFFEWYPDPAHGWRVPTVGYGHTDQAGPPYYKDTKTKTFTQAEIDKILLDDLARNYEPAVKRNVKVPLNENQYGALVSFTFNLGEGNLKKSTLLKKLNAGDYKGAADQFPVWNKAGGRVLKGLVRRRAAERELFLKGVSGQASTPNKTTEPEKEGTTLGGVLLKLLKMFFGVK